MDKGTLRVQEVELVVKAGPGVGDRSSAKGGDVNLGAKDGRDGQRVDGESRREYVLGKHAQASGNLC